MGHPVKKTNEQFTYADYYRWNDSERWELIDGEAWSMSPAPTPRHQEISSNLMRELTVFLKGKPCKVYAAPFDVRLAAAGTADRDILDVVQPDISVICDKNKLDDRGCIGAPDLVIEILSPATSKKDLQDKFRLYEKNGVKEYWVVHPHENTVLVFKLENGIYIRPEMYGYDDKIEVGIFSKELVIDLAEVFEVEEQPEVQPPGKV
jgi:Uma2 family endonuclease